MKTKKLLILQSNYIPWKGYFDAINSVDVFVVYDEVQYTKNDWRNRNKIKTAQGVQWLTIPVKADFGQKIDETLVSQQFWYKKHWKTIKQNYNKSKYFNEISTLLEPLYSNEVSPYLSEINLSFIKIINNYLGINTEIIRSKDLKFEGNKNERLIQICKQLNCNHYISGPAAKSYMDIELFKSKGISIEFMNYSGYPEYEQLFGDFEQGVSILDLLFNEGKNAVNFMKNFNN